MSNKAIQICDAVIQPGESANLALPLPEQYSCAPQYMPIKIINGKKKGPCLLIFSGIKGTELNGIEISNRVMNSICPSKLSGTIIAVPVINIYGLTRYPTPLPMKFNVENSFPGDEAGNYSERIAYIFTHEILKKADYCIELQTGGINHNILPQIYCNFENSRAKQLAKFFNAPVITNVPIENNNLRQTTDELNIPLLVYEAGEAIRFDENAIQLGVEGIKNVMSAVEMLSKKPMKEISPIFSRDDDWILANKAGIMHINVSLGQVIEKDVVIGNISDPFGADIIQQIKTPAKGIVVGINESPLIQEGSPLYKIATFLDYEKAGHAIEEWDKKQPDSYIG